MNFLKDFEKYIEKIEGVGSSSKPPRYWYSTGNFVLNKIVSGKFNNGIPQGRITGLAGPSASGKSFSLANIVKNAQDEGAYILVIDSENALDDDFMSKIGVNTKENYNYKAVTTSPQVTKIVSSFIKGYKAEYGVAEDAPKVLIAIDSLDMLMTETELDNYEKGDTKGDQGQRNKQIKAMLRTFVQDIKNMNISIVVTSQVYKNQDVKNGEGLWIIADAVKYSLSQIILLTKLKLRDDSTKEIEGIRMKCEGVKTRFSKPFQSVTIEVPYEIGMDPLSGLLDVLVSMKIVTQKGSWYQITGTETKFQSKSLATHASELLRLAEAKQGVFLSVENTGEIEDNDPIKSAVKRRQEKAGILLED